MKLFFGKKPNGTTGSPAATPDAAATDNELAAVAALALHRYITEVTSYENAAITMQKFMKPYSPWNSKFYGLRQLPMRVPGRSLV